jgi:hypothetical protein
MHALINVARAVYGAITLGILGMACKQVFVQEYNPGSMNYRIKPSSWKLRHKLHGGHHYVRNISGRLNIFHIMNGQSSYVRERVKDASV